MQFSDNQAIYIQIAEFICEKILKEEWNAGDRIPSVRDLAVSMEVNPNTIINTYDYLQQKEIIFNKRGIGYFVEDKAKKNILKERRQLFMNQELPAFFKNIHLLGFSWEEITVQWERYNEEMKK